MSLSPILYIFYNADLIEAFTKPDNGTVTLGFIDDVAILAVRNSAEKNLKTSPEVHGKAMDWANTPRSVLAQVKY